MSNRWPGGVIRKTPVTPAGPLQNGAASGVWSLADAAYWTKQGLWPLAGNTLAVEDVFSTYLYTGNDGTQTITNGIDLAGKGGLVWTKGRSTAYVNGLVDTARGALNTLISNSTDGSTPSFNTVTAFTSSGFSVGTSAITNALGTTYASWTFREAPKFFDVVTYTGNDTSRSIAHNLGVAPGCIIVKNISQSGFNWVVYHRSTGATQWLKLNLTDAVATNATYFPTDPTATTFAIGSGGLVNNGGDTYVAYLFAHDPTSDGIIQCGSFTTDGSGNVGTVNLGWEPQWVLFKRADGTGSWITLDNMRGFSQTGQNALYPNTSGAEYAVSGNFCFPTATGFSGTGNFFGMDANMVYIAIRRGPMRTPTLGTSVFSIDTYGSTSPTPPAWKSSAVVDFAFARGTGSGNDWLTSDRLRGTRYSFINTTDAEGPEPLARFDYQNGWWNNTGVLSTNYSWMFRRAPGFFDEVCYAGDSTNPRAINHNLGVSPELVIVKARNRSDAGIADWWVYCSHIPSTPFQTNLALNGNFAAYYYGAVITGSSPTTFSVTAYGGVNQGGYNYVSYLFASCPGVSKVGSYTGNGSSQTINCAFTTGSRFVMIKRTDSAGDWYVWDSARGIVAGNDPYLALNTTAAEVTTNDSVDTDNTGFIVNQVAASNVNVNGATYIFLAIA